MDRNQQREHLIDFLRTIQRPDSPISEISEDLSLTESGLIDSLAILQIINYLEETYQIDFQETGADPNDLRSLSAILDLIGRTRGA